MNFAKLVTEDMRLTILQVLAEDTDYSINEDILRSAMSLMGHKVSIDRLRTELSWLEEQGLVHVDDTVGIKVATLTARGLDVKDGAALVPGVKRPAPGV